MGWVCVDEVSGGLVWVPEGEQDTAAEAPPAPPLVVTREDVESLLVDSGSIVVQPNQSWVLVNAETVVFTDAAEHVLTTQLLGRDVELRVVPVRYTWDFGEGSDPVVGTDPGAPWPDHTVSHTYRAAGEARVTLSTEWDASFRVEGAGPWLPVTGRPVTVATSDPFDVVTAVPRLVG
ncbi:PKD domain-containing protein [Georgenia phoenicis]|uniref:PKD domain-containing protein n=1 Tax=unclassified Georgenia TaxID=2626815 RepID=UPI0039B04605